MFSVIQNMFDVDGFINTFSVLQNMYAVKLNTSDVMLNTFAVILNTYLNRLLINMICVKNTIISSL